jgi:hypothetical protein
MQRHMQNGERQKMHRRAHYPTRRSGAYKQPFTYAEGQGAGMGNWTGGLGAEAG